MEASEQLDFILINPRGNELPRRNAIVWRRARDYHFEDFPGSLSIKSVMRGNAVWATGNKCFQVDPSSYIILNRGQDYAMSINASESVETFCLFFQAGFVEDAYRNQQLSHDRLLDEPLNLDCSIGFYERIHEQTDSFRAFLRRMHTVVVNRTETQSFLQEHFIQLASGLLQLRGDVIREGEQLPAVRYATRMELYKRLQTGRHLIDSTLSCPLSLSEVASYAHLSPFHFHRLFTETFGETPHRYHIRRRLERSKNLLTDTTLPVTRICLDVGFQSLGSFSSLFHKRFGMSPRQFRLRYAK